MSDPCLGVLKKIFSTWVTHGLASVVVRRPLASSQGLILQSLQNLVCIISWVRRQEIINFMILIRSQDKFWINSLNLMYFTQNVFLVYSWTYFRQTEYIVMITKIVNLLKLLISWPRLRGNRIVCQGVAI